MGKRVRRWIGQSSLIFKLSLDLKPLRSHKQASPPTQEDYRTKFYNLYRREAEEYDREFIERYDQDLDTTLIFVCSMFLVPTTS